jgi:L-fucose mutarotase/ribose pyranase (RbsD/FucU family)
MLKSIDPLLNGDVLYALRSMGHGDDLVLCNTNFPADAVARHLFTPLLRESLQNSNLWIEIGCAGLTFGSAKFRIS